ncbi:MAG: DUF448 domain-containing protein [Alphaproteobacteria bacterium]|jgi:predicted RNA-binding protein YlxR (DUF448 family)|nr:DUF448 domain-containing protein [Alphaproteobacteria bacterium]MCB9984915.1 DUF448 domain-containing protein [Micavibrio sp.]HPQ50343.1 DUF448 domain-containing protein [Alphaproteobacteria bacterium]
MARKEPELFYHPVVGGMSPAAIALFNFQAFQPPSARPSIPASQNQPPQSSLFQQVEVEPMRPHLLTQPDFKSTSLAPYSERKAMTLLKTATCAVSGHILPQNDMIRFVISPEHKVVADLTGKLPGTFMWISAERQIIKKAIWRNSFASQARDNVEVPDNLLEIIEKGLEKLALQMLSLSKRAGELSFGFSRADEALRSHSAGVYVVAKDSSENGREKLERLAKHQELPVIEHWTCAELSAAIGEHNTNHIALSKGALGQSFLELVKKLNSVRSEK